MTDEKSGGTNDENEQKTGYRNLFEHYSLEFGFGACLCGKRRGGYRPLTIFEDKTIRAVANELKMSKSKVAKMKLTAMEKLKEAPAGFLWTKKPIKLL